MMIDRENCPICGSMGTYNLTIMKMECHNKDCLNVFSLKQSQDDMSCSICLNSFAKDDENLTYVCTNCDSEKRKIVQISAVVDELTDSIYVLCDDNSIWCMRTSSEKWTKLPPIPEKEFDDEKI